MNDVKLMHFQLEYPENLKFETRKLFRDRDDRVADPPNPTNLPERMRDMEIVLRLWQIQPFLQEFASLLRAGLISVPPPDEKVVQHQKIDQTRYSQ